MCRFLVVNLLFVWLFVFEWFGSINILLTLIREFHVRDKVVGLPLSYEELIPLWYGWELFMEICMQGPDLKKKIDLIVSWFFFYIPMHLLRKLHLDSHMTHDCVIEVVWHNFLPDEYLNNVMYARAERKPKYPKIPHLSIVINVWYH